MASVLPCTAVRASFTCRADSEVSAGVPFGTTRLFGPPLLTQEGSLRQSDHYETRYLAARAIARPEFAAM